MGGELVVIGKDALGAKRQQTEIVTGKNMATAAEADDGHACRARCGDTSGAVLDDQATPWRNSAHDTGRVQEEIGSGLTPHHIIGAEHPSLDQRREPGGRKSPAQPFVRAVGSDAEGPIETMKQFDNTGDRLQLAIEGLFQPGSHVCLEIGGQ